MRSRNKLTATNRPVIVVVESLKTDPRTPTQSWSWENSEFASSGTEIGPSVSVTEPETATESAVATALENNVPGTLPCKPNFYATAMSLGGVAVGLPAKAFEGRPVKVEGNPDHPGSQGATDIFSQASILGLYDPDRSRRPLCRPR